MIFNPGDHLMSARRGYDHHGIYLGDRRVLHFSHPPENFFGPRTIRADSLAYFCEGRPAELVHHNEPLPVKEILQRGLMTAAKKKRYSVLTNNCEHFVNDCVVGHRFSRQVRRAAVVFGMILGVVGLTAVIVLRGRKG